MDDIEPMPRPAFAVARGSEEFFHEAGVGVGGGISGEGFNVLRRGREAGEIEIEPAAQRPRIRRGRRRETV